MCFGDKKNNNLSIRFVFRAVKNVHICLFAFAEVIVGGAQAKFIGWQKVIESTSNFDDIAIA